MQARSRILLLPVGALLASTLIACGDDPAPRATETVQGEVGKALTLPEGPVAEVGVGRNTAIAVIASPEGGASLRSLSLRGDRVEVGDAVLFPDHRAYADDLDILELRDGSWLIASETCERELKSASVDGCDAAPVERFYRFENGKGIDSVGQSSRRLDPLDLMAEMPDGRVLVHSSTAEPGRPNGELQNVAFDSFLLLDPRDGSVTPTSWDYVETSMPGSVPLRNTTGCPTSSGWLVAEVPLEGADPSSGQLSLFKVPDDRTPQVVPLSENTRIVVCSPDGRTRAVGVPQSVPLKQLTTSTVNEDGQLVPGSTFDLPGGLDSLSSAAGTLVVKFTTSSSTTDPGKSTYGVAALIGDDWITSDIAPHADEIVKVTGDGKAWVGLDHGSVRVWSR